MNNIIRNYINTVSHQLRCLHPTKERLLAGLEQELRELPAEFTASKDALIQQYGTAADTVRELQLCVSEEEFDAWLNRRKIALWALGIVAVAALAFAFWYVNYGLSIMPMYYIEIIH